MIALLLVPLALAGRVERVKELQAGGDDAAVVETVGKWEKAGSLGDDAAALVALRDRSALNLALAAHTVAALSEWRRTYPTSTLLPEALDAEWALAFGEAQAEGTSAAMRAFVAAYPDSSLRSRADELEAGFAFQEAVEEGTPAAIAAFTRAHPDSPYAANAWESLAAKVPGIHLRLSDGLPAALPGVPVVDGKIALPPAPAHAPARPMVAVNLPGTGRGETSEWWSLQAVDPDGRLGVEPPVERALRLAVGAAPPSLLDLVALPGAHAARVATPVDALVAAGVCEGDAWFAFVLKKDGNATAFPFVVDCGASAPEDAAAPLYLTAFSVAEGGDAEAAGKLWDSARALPGGAKLADWMGTIAPDPRSAFVTRRPAVADVLLWDGTATAWLHPGEGGAVEIARRDGLWIVDGARMWRWEDRVEAWTAPAGGGCKAASGERHAGALVDAIGGERVEVPFAGTDRGGTISPRQYGAGSVAVVEAGTFDGCAKPGAPLPRSVRLPGSAQAPVAPDWAAERVASAPGYSVVTESPWGSYQAFRAGADPTATAAPAGTEGAGAGSTPDANP